MKKIIIRYSSFKEYGLIWESSSIPINRYCEILDFSGRELIIDHSYKTKPDIYLWKDFQHNTQKKNYYRDFYDIVCVGNHKTIKIADIPDGELSSIEGLFINNAIPLDIELPKIQNTFALYCHDDGLYACLKLKSVDPAEILKNTLDSYLPRELSMSVDDQSSGFNEIFYYLNHGLAIGVETIEVINGSMKFAYHHYDGFDGFFGDLVFDNAKEYDFYDITVPILTK